MHESRDGLPLPLAALLEYYTSGDTAKVRQLLASAAPDVSPDAPLASCEWLAALWDYFLYVGDATLLREVWKDAAARLADLRTREDDDGLIAFPPTNTIVQGCALMPLYVVALRSAAKVARTLGMPERGGELEMQASEVRDSLNDRFWNRTLNRYECPDTHRFHTDSALTYMCMAFGIAETRQLALLRGSDHAGVRYLAATNSLELLRLHMWWMLATPEAAIKEGEWVAVNAAFRAGLVPLQPGFMEFAFSPLPVKYPERVSVPTPRGDIVCGFSPESGNFPVTLTVPAGTKAQVLLPFPRSTAPTLVVNGAKVVKSGQGIPGSGAERLEWSHEGVGFPLPAGEHRLEIFAAPS